jgi:hypothetical protein
MPKDGIGINIRAALKQVDKKTRQATKIINNHNMNYNHYI